MKRKLNIGFDIDGVLLDCETYMAQKGSIYLNKPVVNPCGDDIAEMFGVAQEFENAFWRDHIEDFAVSPVAREHIADMIKKLRSLGHKVYIITNRGRDLSFCTMTRECMHGLVEAWLKREQIEYDGLCFANGEKFACCKEKEIDIFVEDSGSVIKKMKKDEAALNPNGNPLVILCYDASYNQEVEGDNIFHVSKSQDIFELCLQFM